MATDGGIRITAPTGLMATNAGTGAGAGAAEIETVATGTHLNRGHGLHPGNDGAGTTKPSIETTMTGTSAAAAAGPGTTNDQIGLGTGTGTGTGTETGTGTVATVGPSPGHMPPAAVAKTAVLTVCDEARAVTAPPIGLRSPPLCTRCCRFPRWATCAPGAATRCCEAPANLVAHGPKHAHLDAVATAAAAVVPTPLRPLGCSSKSG